MKKFTGFTDQETFTRVPDSFFRNLLAEIEAADELKVTLYAIWRFEHMEGRVRFLREKDFVAAVPDPAAALKKALLRGSLLRASPRAADQASRNQAEAALYFLNSPRGRAAAEAFTQGTWAPGAAVSVPPQERPNIFKLYEENIGPLTPLLADALKDAEQTYPPEWVTEALKVAIKNNKRNWRYVEAILKRWKEVGYVKKQDKRDAQEDGRRYSEGEFTEYLKRD